MKLKLRPGEESWDDVVRGLHLRCLKTGRRSWYLFYRTRAGQQRRPKLGEYPVVDIAEARRRAKNLLAQVAVGLDPKGEWDCLKEQPRMDEFFELLWTEHWSKPRYQASGRAREVRRIWRTYVEPRFGSRKVSDIAWLDIQRWYDQLSGTVYQANRALEVVKKIFREAVEREVIGKDPTARVKALPEPSRYRVATPQEIRRIGAAIERHRERWPLEAAFVLLCMATGARPRSLWRIRRDELRVADDGSALVLFHGKTTGDTGEPEVLCIPAFAMQEVVAKLPVREDGLLLGKVDYRRFWDTIRNEAGCPDLWVRDWRRTFASYGLGMGYELGLIGRLLNHRDTRTTTRYAKLMDPRRQQATAQIASSLCEPMGA